MTRTVRATLSVAVLLFAATSAAQPTVGVELGPEYQRIVDSDFVGAAANFIVARSFGAWSVGARAHLFAGEIVGGAGIGDVPDPWSITALDASLGAVVERRLGGRVRLQGGAGVQLLDLDVHHCYDTGDGCWWLGANNFGTIQLAHLNVGLDVGVGLQVDAVRTKRAVLYVAPRLEYTWFVLPFGGDNGDVQPSRSAVTAAVMLGARLY